MRYKDGDTSAIMAVSPTQDRTSAPPQTSPPRSFAPLNRQPSQQDLELAQQLVDHSRGAPPYPSERKGHANGYDHEANESESSVPIRHADKEYQHDLSNGMQAYASSPYPEPSQHQAASASQFSRSQETNGAVPGGQMCR